MSYKNSARNFAIGFLIPVAPQLLWLSAGLCAVFARHVFSEHEHKADFLSMLGGAATAATLFVAGAALTTVPEKATVQNNVFPCVQTVSSPEKCPIKPGLSPPVPCGAPHSSH